MPLFLHEPRYVAPSTTRRAIVSAALTQLSLRRNGDKSTIKRYPQLRRACVCFVVSKSLSFRCDRKRIFVTRRCEVCPLLTCFRSIRRLKLLALVISELK